MEFLRRQLEKRDAEGLLRKLRLPNSGVDFTSNDYLGFAGSAVLAERIKAAWDEYSGKSGSTGSRLLTGHSVLAEETEAMLEDFHQDEAALLFNSGYDANIGLFSTIAGRGDTIIYDELIHASVRDGIRLSLAESFSFRHNNLEDLPKKLGKAKGRIFLAVESVYSMDGDRAPLEGLVKLCAENENLHLIVDEAHANGVYGPEGRGLAAAQDIRERVFARVYTFGKAIGVHGAAVLGNSLLKEYLVNYARSLIYTTAMPPHNLVSVRESYKLVVQAQVERQRLEDLVDFFRRRSSALSTHKIPESTTAIQSVILPGNERVKTVAAKLQQEGYDVRPILSPTVPKGTERIRICLHAFNTEDEITGLLKILEQHS